MGKDGQKFTLFRNATNTVTYPPRTTLFQEGDEGHLMYAIKRGSVRVLVDGKAVETLGKDEVFGEMALLEHRARSATVETLEETELVEIDETQFYTLVSQNPQFALQLMRLLSARLRRANALYRLPKGA